MKRLFLISLVAIAANAQQNALLLPWTPQQFTNTNGTPLANGKVCTYQAGTSTGLASYTDATAATPNSVPPNAILLDSTGRPTSGGIWLKSPLAYKIVVMTAGTDSTCSTGVTIKTQDQVVTGSGAGLNLNNTFTGTNSFTNNTTFTGATNTFPRINAIRTAVIGNAFDVSGSCAGEMGCIINNAIKDVPDGTAVLVYAFGGGTINTNPWATIGTRSGTVSFGPQTWTTNVSLVLPTGWRVEGYGRGSVADGRNTIIKAGGSFPTSTPVFQMGITPGPADGVQIRLLGIDCQNISGVSGIQNQFSQEQSLVEHVLFVNCPGGALTLSGASQNSGPYSDLEVLNFSCSNCSAGTVPISVGTVGFFRGIRGATINSNGSTLPTVALRIDAPGTYSDIHIESAVSSIVVGSQAGTSSVFISNIGCGPSITDCVKISNAFGTQNISLCAINSTTGNIITDQILGNTLTSAGEGGTTAMYVTGNGSPPSLLTSTVNFGEIFGAQTFYKERAAVSGSGGYDACYGDSGIHALKCSYNNGTFFAQTQTVINSTATMTTAAIAAGACGSTVTVGAAGVAATDVIAWAFNAAPAANPAELVVSAWPTSGFVNFQYCNPTAGSVTPSAATLNWRVLR